MFKGNTAGCTEIIIAPLLPCGRAAIPLITILCMTNITIRTIFQGDIVRGKLTDRTAQNNFSAGVFTHITFLEITICIIIAVFIRSVIHTQRTNGFLLVKIRMTPGESKTMCIFFITAAFVGNAHSIASATEVGIANAHHTDNTICGTVTSTDTKGTRTLFLDIQFHNHSVGFHARIHLDIYILKEPQIVNTLHGTAGFLGVKGFANLLTHFPQDNVVLCLGVALYFIALQYAFVDFQRKVAVLINIHIRNLSENITIVAILFLDSLYILLQHAVVQDFAFFDGNAGLQILRLVDGVARNFHTLDNRIFQYMVGQYHTFRNFLECGEQVIEITCIVYCIPVLIHAINREHIPSFHRQR